MTFHEFMIIVINSSLFNVKNCCLNLIEYRSNFRLLNEFCII